MRSYVLFISGSGGRMDWYDTTDDLHGRTLAHEARLPSLPTEWQRELAALWRLEVDVNNGAYLQFLCNWGRESYVYASSALKKIGATRMAEIVDTCQSLIDEHWADKPLDFIEMRESLPEDVTRRIDDLSYEFMDYPDNIEELGLHYYKAELKQDGMIP